MPDASAIVGAAFGLALLGFVLYLVGRGGRSSRTTTTDPTVLHEIQKRASGGNAP